MSLRIPETHASLLRAPVAVFGGGVSGSSVRDLLAKMGAEAVVYDERAGAGDRTTFGEAESSAHRLVVFSPGFPAGHRWLALARGAACVCLGELDFAWLFWRGQIVAITGTNGKTTLTEFLAHALKQAGREAFATGNVGYSFSRLVAERDGGADGEWAVCEVSSFQAEAMTLFRANAVLWTNFAEDHLERHCGLEAYFSAKHRLVLQSPGALVLAGSSVRAHAQRLGVALPAGSLVPTEGLFPDERLAGTVFEHYPQRENFVIASAWWSRSGLPADLLYAAARTFSLGRHRLAKVGEVSGVSWWNDSKATNFHAVEAALARFRAPVVLIAGGRAKGGDIDGFVRRIAPKVEHAFLIGETRAALSAACVRHHVPYTDCASLEAAVSAAAAHARPGADVVLSPGFASFDMFRGYDHRGDVFENLVKNLGARIAAP
ncbi:UDP-N-acetylmuramoylalanine--D-glutamate ligase [mine drainage metagenome]|uniref:UDP-N-acetylmuramoylalanine--D-glutamate ligase n=1 Tax=mine drainage metagenome TaxID=410659 RepID=A0A1J5TEL4_9ZZZZ